jgi:hypothetical protein
MMGMLEFGRAFMAKSILDDAARKACRSAVLPTGTNAVITSEVNDILADNGVASGSATITVQVNGTTADASTAKMGDQISVKVALQYSQIAWTTPFFLSNRTVESETLVMVRQMNN